MSSHVGERHEYDVSGTPVLLEAPYSLRLHSSYSQGLPTVQVTSANEHVHGSMYMGQIGNPGELYTVPIVESLLICFNVSHIQDPS